jgi:hypothetical protein
MNRDRSSSWRERLRSPLTKHVAGLSALVFILLGLLVQLGIDSSALGGDAAATEGRKSEELRALTAATLPLRGVDRRIAATGRQIDAFYSQRIALKYSSISARIGELSTQSGVQLSHVQYSQKARDLELTEIPIDFGVSGGYPQIMRFVNGLERDQTYFVIRAMALQGAQDGQVNLALRVSTWLRAAGAKPDGPSAGAETQFRASSGERGQ